MESKKVIPENAYNIHLFAIKEVADKEGVFQAFIGFNHPNGTFDFIQIPIDDYLIKPNI